MKKVVRIICIVLCVGLILGLGYIVSRKMKKYPEEIEYSALRAFTDNGMYYARRNMLYFLDSPTGYEWIDFRPKAGGTWGKVIVESIGFCICMGNVIYHYKRRRNAKKKDNEL